MTQYTLLAHPVMTVHTAGTPGDDTVHTAGTPGDDTAHTAGTPGDDTAHTVVFVTCRLYCEHEFQISDSFPLSATD